MATDIGGPTIVNVRSRFSLSSSKEPSLEYLETGSDSLAPDAPSNSSNWLASPYISPGNPGQDWIKNLDQYSNVRVLERMRNLPDWKSFSNTKIRDPFLLPADVQTRLFLVEGLTLETVQYFYGIKRDFYRYHCSNVLPYDRWRLDKNSLFGKWFRRAYQAHDQSMTDFKIARGRPYNLDMVIDPEEMKLEHDRYEILQCIPRPCIPVEAARARGREFLLRQAIGENISCFFRSTDQGFIAVILFDAPPTFRTSHYMFGTETNMYGPDTQKFKENNAKLSPRFHGYVSSRQRFVEKLKHILHQEPDAPLELSIRKIIAQLNIDDHMETLSDFRDALDYIDEHMSDNDILRNQVKHWRLLYGQWKKHLSIDMSSISYFKNALTDGSRGGSGVDNKNVQPSVAEVNWELDWSFNNLALELKSLSERAVSTFNAIMATMSIVESQEAIAQAKTVSKLTNLAFFFIPLTLSASIFGMNIVEWQNELHTWIWVTASITITLLTYLVLYFREIATMLSSKDSSIGINHGNLKGTALKVNRTVSMGRHYGNQSLKWCLGETKAGARWGLALVIALVIGYVVGIWAIAAKSLFLPHQDRVKVIVGFSVGIPAFLFLVLMIMVDSRHPKLAFSALACIIVSDGLGIGFLLSGSEMLPYSERVSIAVGIGVGFPCVFLLWVWVFALQSPSRGILWRTWTLLVVPFLLLAPILWYILAESTLNREAKVSLSVGLFFGLPALTGVSRACMHIPWDSISRYFRKVAQLKVWQGFFHVKEYRSNTEQVHAVM